MVKILGVVCLNFSEDNKNPCIIVIAILKEGGGTGKPDRNLRIVVSKTP
jgi:hypothetical protein